MTVPARTFAEQPVGGVHGPRRSGSESAFTDANLGPLGATYGSVPTTIRGTVTAELSGAP
jgi:hypothetical protein